MTQTGEDLPRAPLLRPPPVQLHPVVVMLALLVIVPLVAVAKIVFLFLWSRYVSYGDELVQGAPE